MSITPLMSPPPEPEEPASDGKIARRWLWRQTKALVLFGLGILLGAGLHQQSDFHRVDPNAAFVSQMGGNLTACLQERDQLQAQVVGYREGVAQIKAEQARYATILLEPNTAEKLVVGALGWLVGIPGAGEAVLGGLPGGDRKWILRGKQKPMSAAPNTAYLWIDLETKATEGPFQPEAVK